MKTILIFILSFLAPLAFASVPKDTLGEFPVRDGRLFQFFAAGNRTGIPTTNIEGRKGKPVVALWDGQVLEKGSDKNRGHWISIQHENGLISILGFMGKPAQLKIGARVKRGQKISVMGQSGVIARQGHHTAILVVRVYRGNQLLDAKPFLPEQR